MAPTEEWVTVPVAMAADKTEAKQIERLLVKKWEPELNKGDKPYYLLKDTYARDFREMKKTDHRKQTALETAATRFSGSGTHAYRV